MHELYTSSHSDYFLLFCFLASKHFIRVSSSNPGITRHCYILQASSEYDKRVWMESFWSVIAGNDKSASNTKAESVV